MSLFFQKCIKGSVLIIVECSQSTLMSTLYLMVGISCELLLLKIVFVYFVHVLVGCVSINPGINVPGLQTFCFQETLWNSKIWFFDYINQGFPCTRIGILVYLSLFTFCNAAPFLICRQATGTISTRSSRTEAEVEWAVAKWCKTDARSIRTWSWCQRHWGIIQ